MHAIPFPFSESIPFLKKKTRPLAQPWLSLSLSVFHGSLVRQGHPGMEQTPHRGYHPNLETFFYLLFKGQGPLQEKVTPQKAYACASHQLMAMKKAL